MYFGVGSFWYPQHEFIKAERDLLGRTDQDLTSRTGYAGGNYLNKGCNLCYRGRESYDKKGFAQVVSVVIPLQSFEDFAKVYIGLFVHGHRPFTDNSIDEGAEFRHIIGIPQGINNEFLRQKLEIANDGMLTLVQGVGNDTDNLYKSEFSDAFGSRLFDKSAYVMDSDKFRFHQAEKFN